MSRQPKSVGMNLEALSIDQLRGMKDSIDNDISALSRAHESLRQARNGFGDSKTYLETFKGYKAEQKLLVPLSSSLYVNGMLSDTSNVLVDVGTGYYIQQSVPRAQDFFEKRMNQMKDSMDSIGDALNQKQRQQNMIIDVIKRKAAAQPQSAE